MKLFEWNEEKNTWIKKNRNIPFEEIVFFIENGGLLDTYEHPNKEKYPTQSIFVVKTESYVYLVSYVEEEEYYFLKTVIPQWFGQYYRKLSSNSPVVTKLFKIRSGFN